MNVRPMAVSDLRRVRALAEQLGYAVSDEGLASSFSALVGSTDDVLRVAVVDGEVIGWVHGAGVRILTAPPFTEIRGIVVEERRRGAGAGRALVEAVEAWARERGDAEVRLRTRISREGAHRFYERLGFAKVKTQEAYAKPIR